MASAQPEPLALGVWDMRLGPGPLLASSEGEAPEAGSSQICLDWRRNPRGEVGSGAAELLGVGATAWGGGPLLPVGSPCPCPVVFLDFLWL